MKINLNLDGLVKIGVFTFGVEEFKYEHRLFIAEDINKNGEYYLLDYIVNKSNFEVVKNSKRDVVLEELYITSLSIKKDIPLQIAYFLKETSYIEDIDDCLENLKNIDISHFEVRYNFYKDFRDIDVVFGDILLNYYKVQYKAEDGSYQSIFEHMNLSKLNKMLNLKK